VPGTATVPEAAAAIPEHVTRAGIEITHRFSRAHLARAAQLIESPASEDWQAFVREYETLTIEGAPGVLAAVERLPAK
jgi:hypothetical protein